MKIISWYPVKVETGVQTRKVLIPKKTAEVKAIASAVATPKVEVAKPTAIVPKQYDKKPQILMDGTIKKPYIYTVYKNQEKSPSLFAIEIISCSKG